MKYHKASGKKKDIALVVPEKPQEKQPEPQQAAAPEQPQTQVQDFAARAAAIAKELGETAQHPRKQIKHVLWALGHSQTLALVARAKEIYNGEGMMIPSGTRKRTLGGIFFHLAYSEGKSKPGRELKRPEWKPRQRVVEETGDGTTKEA